MINNSLALDNYEIIRTLGEGYSGMVKLGRNIDTQEMVALKIINKNLKNYSKVLKDLEKESKIMSQLDHKYITKLKGFSS